MAITFFGKPVEAVKAAYQQPTKETVNHDFSLPATGTKDIFTALGGYSTVRSSAVDTFVAIGQKVDETVLAKSLVQLTYYHEQNGTRPLFEIRLNQLLRDGNEVNARVAKDFLLGLVQTGKVNSLSDENRAKAIKLSEVPTVQAELANEKSSVFNPKPAGFGSNMGFKP